MESKISYDQSCMLIDSLDVTIGYKYNKFKKYTVKSYIDINVKLLSSKQHLVFEWSKNDEIRCSEFTHNLIDTFKNPSKVYELFEIRDKREFCSYFFRKFEIKKKVVLL